MFPLKSLPILLLALACGTTPSRRGLGSGSPAGAGGSAGSPSPSITPPTSLESNIGAAVFTPGYALDVEVTLSAEDRQRIEEFGNEEVYVSASIVLRSEALGEVAFDDVGWRHKGNWTLHHCWDDFGGVRSYENECAKLSYKVKFDEFDEQGRLDGLKRLNLHAASGDPAKLRELLAYDTFRQFGIEAPRTSLARLTVNGELEGLFIVVEAVDGRYTKSRHPDAGDGNLYKETWPTNTFADSEFVGALATNEDMPDVSAFRAFAAAVSAATEDTFAADLEPFIDVDEMLRYVAVDRALKNWDGIMAFYQREKPHNFYWYHDVGGDERFHLVPWDLDNALWEFDPYTDPRDYVTAPAIPDWNSTPANCQPRPIWEASSTESAFPPRCDKLLDLLARTGWTRFAEIADELLAGPLAPEALQNKASAWTAELEPLVAEDPHVDVGAWRSAVNTFYANLTTVAADFRSFVGEGLIAETAPEPLTPPPGVNDPTEDVGLVVGGVTNFEFAGTEGEDPFGLLSFGDTTSSFDSGWSAIDPINGSADLRFDFTFVQGPGTWDEWVNYVLPAAGGVQDVSGYTDLVVTLSADPPRSVRLRIGSSAYDGQFGGAWSEFGRDVAASAEPTTVALSLHALAYPQWAKDAWAGSAGWQTTDAEALEVVLSTFTGLIMAPLARADSTGVLVADTDPGVVRIDDIYFK